MKRTLAGALLALTVVLAAASVPQARSIAIANFHADIEVRVDGSVSVTEQIDFAFEGSWQGIYRTIPVRYRTPLGFNYSLRLDVQGAYDENGSPLEYEVSNAGYYREIKIWVPNAEDATRRVVLKYQVRNALQFFDDHDELYWNVTGDEWEFPIQSASAKITLPAGAGSVRATAYSGVYGSRATDADVTISGNEVRFEMLRELSFREGLTAVVGWGKGLIEEPPLSARVGDFLRSNFPLGLPVLVFLIMFRVWYTRGRDPRLNPIAVRYEPPDGLSPAEAGTLIDNSADMRDVTATIVDLAVKGYILIEDTEKEQLLGLLKSTEYVFHLKKPGHEWGELRRHERKLLDSLFLNETRNKVSLSDLENSFYRNLPEIRDRIFESLLSRQYYRRRPDAQKGIYIVLGIFIGFMVMGFGIVMGDYWGVAPVTAVLSGVLTLAVMVGFGLIMPARTKVGARALEGVLGFEEFLERVESDKYERVEMTPDLFERFLPFAMAFGVERRWAKAFDGIYNAQPTWYQGRSPISSFRPALFAASLGQMSTRASRAMASSPRSRSGGSGFSSGGGRSGGGFGGGGGRGF